MTEKAKRNQGDRVKVAVTQLVERLVFLEQLPLCSAAVTQLVERK